MTQGELVVRAGSGYQTHSSGRRGDYSTMSVDPTDDCTFWYTQEYYATSSSAGWQTRVGSFRLRDCGAVDTPPTVTLEFPAEGVTVSGSVAVEIGASDSETPLGALTVEWRVDSGAWQPAAYDAALNRYTASWDTTTVGDGAHTLSARATDGGGHVATDSNGVTVDNVADPPTTHVGDLDRSSTHVRNSWTATVSIRIHSEAHADVAGATVSGSWSSGGSASCVTSAAGQCAVSKSGLAKKTSSVTFTVTGVTHASRAYQAAANHDPDGDSNGTSMTVPKS
jgi:hypothetical protein